MKLNGLKPMPDNLQDYLAQQLGRPPYAVEPHRPKSFAILKDPDGTEYISAQYDKIDSTI